MILSKKSSRTIVKESIKTIASQSSIHGLPNIINSEYLVMKIVWMFGLLLALSYSSYLLVQLIISYFNYDVLISINYSADYGIDFPAIAICDLLPINRSLDNLVLSCFFNSEPCDRTYFGKVRI